VGEAWRGEKSIQGFGEKERDHLRDRGVDGIMG
jgi:hypothetical protein